jgi:hypothetical protein
VLQFSKACLLLVTFVGLTAFRVWAETFPDQRPTVVVSVYNDADVPAAVLTQAEQEAQKIFGRAGLEVLWTNCASKQVVPGALVRGDGRNSHDLDSVGLRPTGRAGTPAIAWSELRSSDCVSFEWPTHLALRVVPQDERSTNEVFGAAFLSDEGTGCYSDVFYDRIIRLHAQWNVDLADILGNVMAHELGHLLLGSNSHAGTGIMRARWQGEELRRVSRGGLGFTKDEGNHMRGLLNAGPRELAGRSSY